MTRSQKETVANNNDQNSEEEGEEENEEGEKEKKIGKGDEKESIDELVDDILLSLDIPINTINYTKRRNTKRKINRHIRDIVSMLIIQLKLQQPPRVETKEEEEEQEIESCSNYNILLCCCKTSSHRYLITPTFSTNKIESVLGKRERSLLGRIKYHTPAYSNGMRYASIRPLWCDYHKIFFIFLHAGCNFCSYASCSYIGYASNSGAPYWIAT